MKTILTTILIALAILGLAYIFKGNTKEYEGDSYSSVTSGEVNSGEIYIKILGGRVKFYEPINYIEVNWKKEIFASNFVRIDKYRIKETGDVREKVLTSKTLNTGAWNGFWDKNGLAPNEYIRIDDSIGSENAIYIGGYDKGEANIKTLIERGQLIYD